MNAKNLAAWAACMLWVVPTIALAEEIDIGRPDRPPFEPDIGPTPVTPDQLTPPRTPPFDTVERGEPLLWAMPGSWLAAGFDLSDFEPDTVLLLPGDPAADSMIFKDTRCANVRIGLTTFAGSALSFQSFSDFDMLHARFASEAMSPEVRDRFRRPHDGKDELVTKFWLGGDTMTFERSMSFVLKSANGTLGAATLAHLAMLTFERRRVVATVPSDDSKLEAWLPEFAAGRVQGEKDEFWVTIRVEPMYELATNVVTYEILHLRTHANGRVTERLATLAHAQDAGPTLWDDAFTLSVVSVPTSITGERPIHPGPYTCASSPASRVKMMGLSIEARSTQTRR